MPVENIGQKHLRKDKPSMLNNTEKGNLKPESAYDFYKNKQF